MNINEKTIHCVKICTIFFTTLLMSASIFGQNSLQVVKPTVSSMKLEKITKPASEIKSTFDGHIVRTPKLGYHPKHDWPLHEKTNKEALPLGIDPAWQINYPDPNRQRNLINQWEGQGPDGGFNPGDPSLDVGPNHVVQMVNSVGGSNVQVWDKSGNSLANFTFDDPQFSNISGAGDPIVIYDQLADRWLLSEFGDVGNVLIVAISQTPDPAGAYFVYSYNTPAFPDYPKYGIWNDSYIVTTNEANSRIYALDRTAMLAGNPAPTAQDFDLTNFNTIGFQAGTPVNLDGMTLPPAGSPAMIMRMADDGWTGVTQDRLEIFELTLDFATPANSSLTGPINLPTQPFDTELNGFTSFSAIAQPGSTIELDPLREVLMNKIIYRNFGTHESLVCNHVTDVTGNDDAGVRWYELRRTGGTAGSWVIHQQGTYSPDNTSRWMASIGINVDGSIGLAYNVSDATSVFPGLRYTGRKECDPLGNMTFPETTIIDGSAANASNRYGDYNTLSVDPTDGTFWFTGQYNPTSTWATRVANFEIPFDCFGIKLTPVDLTQTVCQPTDATYDFDMELIGGFTGNVTFSAAGLPAGTTATFSTNPASADGTYTMTVAGTGAAAAGTYTITITGVDGAESDDIMVELIIDAQLNTAAALLTPPNGAPAESTSPSYTWSAVPGANSYDIIVATDMALTNVVETATVTSTSYMGNTLNTLTQYYWTVVPSNSCGPSSNTTVFDFTTANIVCVSYPSTDTPLTLNDVSINTSSILIGDVGNITDVNILSLTITHTFTGDLDISLTSPNGTVAIIFNDQCAGDNNILTDIDDAGGAVVCPIAGGVIAPVDPFSVFNGESISGVWTLTIEDDASGDVGTLDGWTLELCGNISAPNCPTTAPTLTSPADMAIDEILAPGFSWTAVPDAVQYTIEIATDAAFTNIVVTDVSNSTSYTPSMDLNAQTTYYWRVTGFNSCGSGPASSAFQFTTANIVCMSYASTDTPIVIPDTAPPNINTSTITVPDMMTITDVNVLSLEILHTFIGDLIITLTHVDTGTSAQLMNDQCGTEEDILGDFDDSGVTIPCPPSGGVYAPINPFSVFNGEDFNGTWTLTIEDEANVDGGSLESWTLELCGITPSAPCPPEYANATELTGTQSVNADFETDGIIESTQTVDSGSTVDYDSAISVLLKEDFETILGVSFHAFIDGCGGAMLRSEENDGLQNK